jgi:hypothetical protein
MYGTLNTSPEKYPLDCTTGELALLRRVLRAFDATPDPKGLTKAENDTSGSLSNSRIKNHLLFKVEELLDHHDRKTLFAARIREVISKK